MLRIHWRAICSFVFSMRVLFKALIKDRARSRCASLRAS